MRLTGFIILVLCLTGCESIPFVAYKIESEQTFFVEGNAEQLCSHLAVVAKDFSLKPQEPRRVTTLCYFMNEVDDEHHLLLGARVLESNVVVVVTARNRDAEYKALTASILRMLQAAYPEFDPTPIPYVGTGKQP